MPILVTAFGPFDGREENASALALRELKRTFPGIRTRILPVDLVIAPMRLKRALRILRPSALIMLGEGAGIRQIQLETTAWNELDFRIPDLAGRQPTGRAIVPGAPAQLGATLPMRRLLDRLTANGHDAILSRQPGRYLCNQVFYIALQFLADSAIPCPAGFIHLPLASDYPVDRNVAALNQVLAGVQASACS